MAKKSKIAQTKRSAQLIQRYKEQRAALASVIKDPRSTTEERLEAYRKLARIPRRSSRTRYRNRCQLTGRARAYMRKFRLCRVAFRELALEGKLPGVTKSSW